MHELVILVYATIKTLSYGMHYILDQSFFRLQLVFSCTNIGHIAHSNHNHCLLDSYLQIDIEDWNFFSNLDQRRAPFYGPLKNNGYLRFSIEVSSPNGLIVVDISPFVASSREK